MTTERFVHVASSQAAARVIVATLARLGREEEVIALGDVLNEGPLHDVDVGGASRIAWWERIHGTTIEDLAPDIEIDDSSLWKRLQGETTDIVLWHGPHPMERIFELRACWHLRGHAERLFEVALTPSGVQWHASPRPDFYNAVPIAGPNVCAASWASHSPIRNVAERARAWEALRDVPGDAVHLLDGDQLVRLPVTAYDAHLLAAFEKRGGGWTESNLIVASVLGLNPVTLSLLRWRVRELMRVGTLFARGDDNDLDLPAELALAEG